MNTFLSKFTYNNIEYKLDNFGCITRLLFYIAFILYPILYLVYIQNISLFSYISTSQVITIINKLNCIHSIYFYGMNLNSFEYRSWVYEYIFPFNYYQLYRDILFINT